VRCPICAALAGERLLGQVPTTHPGPFQVSSYRLVQCEACDVVRLDPIPNEQDLDTLYRRSVQFSDAHYTDPDQVRRMLEYYGSCLDNLGLMPADGEAMLEVGAGWAWVARACRARSSRVTTWAQDVTDECATRCPWVDRYLVGTVDKIPIEQRFRLISLTHVIEHLPDPASMLRTLAGRLIPGGRLFVTAPFRPIGWRSGDGVDAWLSYSYLHVPAHIAYLSRRWFDDIGATCGLRLERWDASHEGGQAFEAVLRRV
jgi:SAM-dependent methyltransferase